MPRRLLVLFPFAIGLAAIGFFCKSAKQGAYTLNSEPAAAQRAEIPSSPTPSPKRYLTVAEAQQLERALGFGSIGGRIVNDTGRTVRNVAVAALPRPGRMGIERGAVTNSKGQFMIKHLEVGNYELSVSNQEAGYDRTENRFYSVGFVEMPSVLVQRGKTVWAGDVHLGPKAGKLVGTLRDAKTKRRVSDYIGPMQTRHVVLCRVNDPKNCSDASPHRNGHFEILVPPVSFTIQASAPGYEKNNWGPLRLKGGEIKRFDILLTPIK